MATADLQALCLEPAVEIRRRLWEREVSVSEITRAHLETIERLNPSVNAIVTLRADEALAAAARADAELARGRPVGPLHGLVVAHKDATETAGVRTTFGSPAFSDHVPDRSAVIVERMQRAGAISVGKTNVPEWAAGSNCVNPVFGATRNPYDLTRTPGGSSGGAAAALACGMISLADGSDMGGSLRNPASFCNVVGLRPAPGRVPAWPAQLPWDQFSVYGPMGRTVADVALMLSAIAGPDDRSPISLTDPGERFASPPQRDWHGVRVAWSRTLGGLPIEPEVTDTLAPARDALVGLGLDIVDAEPDFTGAREAFTTWRAWSFEAQLGELVRGSPELVGAKVTWNVEQGRALTGRDLARAERAHAAVYHRTREFMEGFELLLAPVAQVVPFPYELDYPRSVAGVEMETYLDWMQSCWRVSTAGLPAISVPGGFTAAGLPVGLQMVGRPRDELSVLSLALAFERETGHWRRRPPLV